LALATPFFFNFNEQVMSRCFFSFIFSFLVFQIQADLSLPDQSIRIREDGQTGLYRTQNWMDENSSQKDLIPADSKTEGSHSCFQLSIWMEEGVRTDDFKWVLMGPGTNPVPKIVSKVKWKDLKIRQLGGGIKFLTGSHVYGRFNGDFGWIVEGKVKEVDHFPLTVGDQPTIVQSASSSNRADKGQVYDLSTGIGYQFLWFNHQFKFSPLIGYSYHSQHLRMPNLDHLHYYSKDSLPLTPLFQRSLYKARWYGPWLGVDLSYQLGCGLQLFGTYERHWDFYRASGRWILRSDLPPHFAQHANARGYIMNLGLEYDFKNKWSIKGYAQYQIWCTRIGSQITHVIGDTGLPVKASQPLKFVEWRSLSFIGSFGYNF
jgi:hypothetical protein